MKAEKEHNKTSEITLLTEEGKVYEIQEEGSLSLLALGYKGLMAWRDIRNKMMSKPS